MILKDFIIDQTNIGKIDQLVIQAGVNSIYLPIIDHELNLYLNVKYDSTNNRITKLFYYKLDNDYKILGILTDQNSLEKAIESAFILNQQQIMNDITLAKNKANNTNVNEDLTLEEFILRYQNHIKDKVKPLSFRRYRDLNKQILKIFGNTTKLSSINKNEVIKILQTYYDNGTYSHTNINAIADAITRVYGYAVSVSIVKVNEYVGLKHLFKRDKTKHREALNCQNFKIILDAQEAIENLFKFTWSMFDSQEKNTKCKRLALDFIRLLAIHLIIGTRITETRRFFDSREKIKNEDLDFILIETKKIRRDQDPTFELPISPLVKKVLLNLPETVKFCTFERYFYKGIQEFKDSENHRLFSFHGSRSLFRTCIDFLVPEDNMRTAKEMYIDHNVDSSVQQIYHRNSFKEMRLHLQIVYGDFIKQCFKNVFPNEDL